MGTLSDAATLQAGRPWPLGATWDKDAQGVNFALFSAHAQHVELCLWPQDGTEASSAVPPTAPLCLPMPCCTDQVWHAYLPGARPGLRYAYRVWGPEGPAHRFKPPALLLDPYARAVDGSFSYGDTENASGLRAIVTDSASDGYDWHGDASPAVPWNESLLYEAHVKGMTQRHPEVPAAARGTYAGLATPTMLAHFKRLGVTALKLLPIHGFLDEQRLMQAGLRNYWGYNTLSFFAPERRYAARGDELSLRDEFRDMVRALHANGIELILDVVFNHTAETDGFGPTISFRGIDNASYYRLRPDAPGVYENFSGCGNTFKLAQPRVLQLVMDALRYWVEEMHVDGFRFDLAVALTRDSAFLAAVAQDPVLSRVKLIAEPWDLGPDGYRLGAFPPGWSEWNDRFRDDVRAFWLTGEVGIGALAQRLAGSSEVFRHDGRRPSAGVNFITAHDGFTLRDLVSYRHKHNEANGEQNRDGHGHNLSTNCGVEGPTDDPAVLACRQRLQRALLCTLFVAQGVPMLQGGDEIGRTQQGNNNAYCQDNELTWLDWSQADADLDDFVGRLGALRRRLEALRQHDWLTGAVAANGERDVTWWHADGRPMHDGDWQAAPGDFLGMLLSHAQECIDGEPSDVHPGRVLVAFNRSAVACVCRLPPGRWRQACDSGNAARAFVPVLAESTCTVAAQSVLILAQEPN